MDLGLVFSGCHRRGGVERSVYEMARWARSHHEVTVYAAEVDRTDLDGVRVVQVGDPASRPGPRAFGRAAAPLVGRHDATITFGVMDVPSDVLWVNSVHRAWLQAARRLHEGGSLRHPALRYAMPKHVERLRLERRYFRRPGTRHVVTVADQVAVDLQALYGVPRQLCTTVHNGFAPDEFSLEASLAGRAAARRDFGLPADAPVAVMVANELERKGLGVTLEALALVPELHLLLVGRARPDAYAARIAELGLEDRFHDGGPVPDTARALAAADVFVLPTRYEAFCLAVVESLAAGVPVVTTDVPGAADLVRTGVNGAVVPVEPDATVLAGALQGVLDVPDPLAHRRATAASVADHTWHDLFSRTVPGLARAT